ncbi:hypothetical protein ACLOJK_036848 [Asimina triloba]
MGSAAGQVVDRTVDDASAGRHGDRKTADLVGLDDRVARMVVSISWKMIAGLRVRSRWSLPPPRSLVLSDVIDLGGPLAT